MGLAMTTFLPFEHAQDFIHDKPWLFGPLHPTNWCSLIVHYRC